MSDELVPCIYCSKPSDPRRGQGDHIIPIQLGVFRGDRRFRGCCPACNNTIGRSEQQLLHCGPEAFFRRALNIASPPGRKRGHSLVGAVMGVRGPEYSIFSGDHRELVRPIAGDLLDVNPADQLIVPVAGEDDKHMLLFPEMSANAIKQKAKQMEIRDINGSRLSCTDEHSDHYRRILQEAFPNTRYQELAATEAGTHRRKGRSSFFVDSHYFRAIAKIGFHHLLVHSRRGFTLLEYLIRHAGQVVSRTMLLEKVWDINQDPLTNVVDVHINRLRKKVDHGFKPALIHTIRGVVYVLRE